MNAVIVLACIWALLLRLQVWVHDYGKEITGCKHEKGELVPSVPGVMGRMTALVWCCNDCRFQIALKVYRRPGDHWIRIEDVGVIDDAPGQDHPGEGETAGSGD